jgi:hypothetical protein
LQIDDHVRRRIHGLSRRMGALRAVAAAFRRHHRFGTERGGGLGNAGVVGGDADAIHILGRAGKRPDPLYHRNPGHGGQWFAGKSGRAPTGGNDDDGPETLRHGVSPRPLF